MGIHYLRLLNCHYRGVIIGKGSPMPFSTTGDCVYIRHHSSMEVKSPS